MDNNSPEAQELRKIRQRATLESLRRLRDNEDYQRTLGAELKKREEDKLTILGDLTRPGDANVMRHEYAFAHELAHWIDTSIAGLEKILDKPSGEAEI